jgi:hypothetical protein
MDRRGGRGRSCAVKLSRGTVKPTTSVTVAREVRDYPCFLRLLPRRVYSAIVTGIWETVVAPKRIRTELLHKRSVKPPS